MLKAHSKNITVSIGIPVYNEEGTIIKLLSVLEKQIQTGFELMEIFVYSDGSTDRTNNLVKKYKNKKLTLISSNDRKGKIFGIKEIVRKSKGNVILLIDADIAIQGNTFVSTMIRPFIKDKRMGLVSGNRVPVKVESFIEKAIFTSIRAYDSIGLHMNNGANPFNCHGGALAIKRALAVKLNFPQSIFDTDTYLYFSCLHEKYTFHFAKNAVYKIKLANTLEDVLSQYKRYLIIDAYSSDKFSRLIKREYSVPFWIRLKYILKELMLDPIHTITMYFIIQYSKNAKNIAREANPTWAIAGSTKGRL
jgi:glycosyltransferase involved in cell wall biosynthesis